VLHVRRNLDSPPGAYALFSGADIVETAVIFVHGFNGHPESTWFEFQTLIDSLVDVYPWWATSDVFFFSYESVSKPLRVNAARLREFLNRIFPVPDSALFQIPLSREMAAVGIDGNVVLRDVATKYSKLVIAAHSEGAVLVRMVVRDITHEMVRELFPTPASDVRVLSEAEVERGADLKNTNHREVAGQELIKSRPYLAALNAQLRLFSPAQCGSSITGFWGTLLEWPGIRGLIRAAMRASPAQVDLKPTSGLLADLRRELQRLAREDSWIPALSAQILWGEDDTVVHMDKFQFDAELLVPGRDHTSVCKPTMDYQDPLGFVKHGNYSEPTAV
jgi:hypothetical protein